MSLNWILYVGDDCHEAFETREDAVKVMATIIKESRFGCWDGDRPVERMFVARVTDTIERPRGWRYVDRYNITRVGEGES